MGLFQYFIEEVDGNRPETNLPNPQGALSKKYILSSSISLENREIIAGVLPSLMPLVWRQSGERTSRLMLRKAETGLCAAEHGVLATVQYYITKLPLPLTSSGLGVLSSTHSQNYSNEALKTNYSRNFRPAKYKYGTILRTQHTLFCTCTQPV